MKKRQQDYVIGLITGHFEPVKVGDKFILEFKPRVTNINNRIGLLATEPKYKDSTRQEILEKEGIIKPSLVINRSEFTKLEGEKLKLKRLKKEHNANKEAKARFFIAPQISFEVWKLVQQLNNKFKDGARQLPV